jgi:hypothetical protein
VFVTASPYAANSLSSACRSNDQRKHLARIPGFNFDWAHLVMPDLAATQHDLHRHFWRSCVARSIGRRQWRCRYSNTSSTASRLIVVA